MKKILLACLLILPLAAKAQCVLSVPNISLGVYNPLLAPPPPSLVALQITCTDNTAVVVNASRGNANTYENRLLRQGMESVRYNLYTGTTDEIVWGDGTYNTAGISALVPSNTPMQIVGNAQVVPGQSPTPGLYTDTLIFTLVF